MFSPVRAPYSPTNQIKVAPLTPTAQKMAADKRVDQELESTLDPKQKDLKNERTRELDVKIKAHFSDYSELKSKVEAVKKQVAEIGIQIRLLKKEGLHEADNPTTSEYWLRPEIREQNLQSKMQKMTFLESEEKRLTAWLSVFQAQLENIKISMNELNFQRKQIIDKIIQGLSVQVNETRVQGA